MCKGLVLILCSVLGVFSYVYADEPAMEARRHYEKGNLYYQQGYYQEALEEFQKALDVSEPKIPPGDISEGALAEEKIVKLAVRRKVEEEDSSSGNREYTIDVGDTLDISVWKVPDLSSSEVIVRPDEKISLPLIGDIQAVGRTLTELDAEVTEKYALYVREPQVSVMIKKFGGSKVVVLGDVKTPGVYSFSGAIRLAEAIALAGDCTKYAVRNNILVIRGDIHNNPEIISANMISFVKNAKLGENILIQPQDVVFVPRSVIGNVSSFFETIAPIIDGVYKTSTTDIYIKNARRVMEKRSTVSISQ